MKNGCSRILNNPLSDMIIPGPHMLASDLRIAVHFGVMMLTRFDGSLPRCIGPSHVSSPAYPDTTCPSAIIRAGAVLMSVIEITIQQLLPDCYTRVVLD
jgi:hypothetical protein